MEKEQLDNSYAHILKYTGIFGGVQGMNILVGLVRNKLVALILGPDGMGLISLFNSTIKLLSDSTNLGISMTAVRELSAAYELGDKQRLHKCISVVRMWCLLTALVGSLLCIVLSPLLNTWTFTWGDHVLHFILLSPVVALMAIMGGELAILKATRQLKSLAAQSVYSVLGTLVFSVPLYLVWKQAAIVPSLILVAFVQLFFTIIFSFRLYPFRLTFGKWVLSDGFGMVRLGVAFVLAGILGSGAEFVIRSFLNTYADLAAVGLYNAGYLITITYSGMVFQAMETDYFPRLSAAAGTDNQNVDTVNMLVNRQIEVSLLLVGPLMVAFVVALPILLPLLLSSEFYPIIDMMRFAALAMILRAVSLPIEYISLAKGASWSYLCLELFYDVLIVLLIVSGYLFGELTGTGFALFVAGALNLLMVLFFMSWRFGYELSRQVVVYFCVLFSLGVITSGFALLDLGVLSWVVEGAAVVASFSFSLRILYKKSQLWSSLVEKVRRKCGINKRD